MSPSSIVAYVVLFAGAALLFGFVSLLIGRLLRPSEPVPEKRLPYECGEPAVGSADLQFDLRFYVVALVFIIFEVEVAFFFPWAAVYGTLNGLAIARSLAAVAAEEASLGVPPAEAAAGPSRIASAAGAPEDPPAEGPARPPSPQGAARWLAAAAIVDMAVFFGVLLVGFAYVWRRGDLNWVRAFSPRPAGGRISTAPP
jgi:NADH-quinone oxidoreductase subunit A